MYNCTYHLVKIIFWYLVNYKVYEQKSWYDHLTFWNALFVVSLSFLIVVTGVRLLTVANHYHLTSYRTHRTYIITMVICIVVCEPSNFYAVFMNENELTENKAVKNWI